MNDIIDLTVTNGKPTTTSLQVAERFGKKHFNVLRDIESLECSEEFSALNFEGCTYKGENGKLLPMYAITKDGFMFLAMGFTGKEAAAWKERFIVAFNKMERMLLEASKRPRGDSALQAKHGADLMVSADRTFRSLVRAGRSAGLTTGQAIHRANDQTKEQTGIDLLQLLGAQDIVHDKKAPPSNHWAFGVRGAQLHLEDFWSALNGSGIDGIVFAPMLSTQLGQLYVHWCRSNRIMPLHFARLVEVLDSAQLVRRLRKRLKSGDDVLSNPVSIVVLSHYYGPPGGYSEDAWLAECIENMRTTLKEIGV